MERKNEYCSPSLPEAQNSSSIVYCFCAALINAHFCPPHTSSLLHTGRTEMGSAHRTQSPTACRPHLPLLHSFHTQIHVTRSWFGFPRARNSQGDPLP